MAKARLAFGGEASLIMAWRHDGIKLAAAAA